MARPVAALTGATGFLGRWLGPALARRGYDLRILTSRDPLAPSWRSLVPEVVVGRLSDAEALRRLAEGAAVVIHAAGLIKAPSRERFFSVNAGGAAAAARIVREVAPEARFVLVSSLTAREPQLSDYAASKAAGEAAVRELLAPERLVIVRPPAVYGPGDRETLAVFQAAARLPFLPLLGPDDARFALVHVADAAEQIAELAIRGPFGAAAWALADARPEGYGWREIVQSAARAVGAEAGMVRVPAAVVAGLAAVSAVAGRLAGTAPIFTPGKARELLHGDWSVGPDELAPAVRACRFDLESGFVDTVAWYREQAWL